jgi:predicted ATP-grasp superfamily ATP-dependent carboligase
MDELVELSERPKTARVMIAGWHQWADAGQVSSGLPEYLIRQTHARRIGAIRPGRFYLFQIPGTHHLLRPVVRLKYGLCESMETRSNLFHYAGTEAKGFVIFLGHEPHQDEERYAEAFLDVAEALNVKRVIAVAGVHGPVPYNRSREISCVYSLPSMQDDLASYSVKPSNYEGGTTIGTYIAHRAGLRAIEMVGFYALCPAYDFSKGAMVVQQVSMDDDYQAWHDVMVRINSMGRLDVNLSDLERRSETLQAAWDAKIEQLAKVPHLDVRNYLAEVEAEFNEASFEPLSHVWEDALDQILDDDVEEV